MRWPRPAALVAVGVLSTLLYPAAVPLGARLGLPPLAAHQLVFGLLFVLYLVALWLTLPAPRATRTLLAIVLGFGLLFRVATLATPVYLSSDIHRYLWDGRVQLSGVNPYRYPPSAPELAHLRDGHIHPWINRPWARTVYPPATQWLFALAAWRAPLSILGWRLLMLVFDAAAVALLLWLLRGLAVPATAVAVYAWSPLVVFEGIQAAHVDAAMLAMVLLALALRQAGSSVGAGLALGLAVLMKLYPAILVVAWWRRRDRRFPLTVALTVGLAYLPYAATVGGKALGFLPDYFGSGEDFNVGLRGLLQWTLGLQGETGRAAVMALLFFVLGAAVVWIGRTRADDPAGLWRATGLAIAAYLLLVPTSLHPWYVLWLVPFLCASRSPAWLYFSGAVTLSYMKYLAWEAPMPWWLWAAEYVPLYALLLASAYRALAARAPGGLVRSPATPTT